MVKGMATESLHNPSDIQRNEMLKNSLTNVGRPEDYENIVELLNPPIDITNYANPGQLKGIKIGIIGAGLAGLAAAFELRKLGAHITIFEALEDRIGGRVFTYYFDKEKKYFGEFGPMRIPVSHQTTWHYINTFKLNTEALAAPDSIDFLYLQKTRIRNTPDEIEKYLYPKFNLSEEEKNTPWPKLQAYASNYILNNLSPQVRSELLKILPIYSPEYEKISRMSTRDSLEMLGLSQAAISLIAGTSPLLGSFFNHSYDDSLHEIYTLDFFNLYKISGGMVNLPLAFYQSLTSTNPSEYTDISSEALGKVDFKSGHIINGIEKDLNTNSVLLKYQNASSPNIAEAFDYVVCTIPFSTLRLVDINPYFQNQKMRAITELDYIDAQKTLFYCNRRFWEEDADYGRINGRLSFTDLPIQSIGYPTDHIHCNEFNICSPNEPGVLLGSYGLSQDAIRVGNLNEKKRFEFIKRNVEEVHGIPNGSLESIVEGNKTIHWNSQQEALGAFAMYLPGQKINFAYQMLEPEYNNRVFFAGEHTSTKHGWMQGALYSGKLAANTLAYHNSLL